MNKKEVLDIYERGVFVMGSDRLTWGQIVEKYPYQYVGLADIEREESYDSVLSAIVDRKSVV